jgi:hypothetical protein
MIREGVVVFALESTGHGENRVLETGACAGAKLCGGATALPLAFEDVIVDTTGE